MALGKWLTKKIEAGGHMISIRRIEYPALGDACNRMLVAKLRDFIHKYSKSYFARVLWISIMDECLKETKERADFLIAEEGGNIIGAVCYWADTPRLYLIQTGPGSPKKGLKLGAILTYLAVKSIRERGEKSKTVTASAISYSGLKTVLGIGAKVTNEPHEIIFDSEDRTNRYREVNTRWRKIILIVQEGMHNQGGWKYVKATKNLLGDRYGVEYICRPAAIKKAEMLLEKQGFRERVGNFDDAEELFKVVG